MLMGCHDCSLQIYPFNKHNLSDPLYLVVSEHQEQQELRDQLDLLVVQVQTVSLVQPELQVQGPKMVRQELQEPPE
jgi:hypothetical protein